MLIRRLICSHAKQKFIILNKAYFLDSLDGVSSEELDELEKQLDQVEQLLNSADLDKQVG